MLPPVEFPSFPSGGCCSLPPLSPGVFGLLFPPSPSELFPPLGPSDSLPSTESSIPLFSSLSSEESISLELIRLLELDSVVVLVVLSGVSLGVLSGVVFGVLFSALVIFLNFISILFLYKIKK